jgi:hypothetical protein
MVGAWPFRAYTFRALRKSFGPMWLRCDVCRRYAPLVLGGLQDCDYRSKTFSCVRCGAAGSLCIVEPSKETGMTDYRLDPCAAPVRHPAAEARLRRGRQPPVPLSGRHPSSRHVGGPRRER